MTPTRVFLDTAYVQARLNRADDYHALARRLSRETRDARIWVSEAVLVEIADAFSKLDRRAADEFVRSCYGSDRTTVVPLDTDLLMRGLDLYGDRQDKHWSLTDCISFVVMGDNRITDALTADHHFVQAGFRALMLEDD